MTNEARSILENIIEDFEPEKFVLFFRRKARNFHRQKKTCNTTTMKTLPRRKNWAKSNLPIPTA